MASGGNHIEICVLAMPREEFARVVAEALAADRRLQKALRQQTGFRARLARAWRVLRGAE